MAKLIDIEDFIVRQNSLKAWFLASRPKTLTAAAVPVMLATAMAWTTHGTEVNWLAAVLCFLFAFTMQIDANFVNDYFDCVRGNDDETRLGPKRACAMGWISLRAMRWAMVITSLVSCVVGLPLAWIGGWEMIAVGISCVLFCFLYTTCLSYWGMGDLLVLVFFGIVPVCCSYYVETGTMSTDVFLVSLACGLVIDTLLIINNYRDIENDRRAGKRTIAVFIGKTAMLNVYLAILPVAVVVMMLVFKSDLMYAASFLLFVVHVNTWNKMKQIGEGRALNRILGMTARNIFLFGILSSAAIIFA